MKELGLFSKMDVNSLRIPSPYLIRAALPGPWLKGLVAWLGAFRNCVLGTRRVLHGVDRQS